MKKAKRRMLLKSFIFKETTHSMQLISRMCTLLLYGLYREKNGSHLCKTPCQLQKERGFDGSLT
jgi:hypothetical protein